MSASFHQRGKKWEGRSTLSSNTVWQEERKRSVILPMQTKPGFWHWLAKR